MKIRYIGMIAVLLSAVMWALEPIFAKISYVESTFLQTSLIRAYVVALIAFGYILIKQRKTFYQLNKQQISALCYIAIFGTLGADLIYFYALTSTPVLNAVLIGHLQPVFIILFAFFMLNQERLETYTYLGIGVMMLSAVAVSTKTVENALSLQFGTSGDVFVLVATMLWATTALVMRKYLLGLHAGTITFFRFFIASIVFSFFLPLIDITQVNFYQILVGIVVGIGTICYYEGLKRLKAAEVSGIELAAPVFAAGIGFFVLNESITALQILGIILLFIGVFFITSEKPKIVTTLFQAKRGKQ